MNKPYIKFDFDPSFKGTGVFTDKPNTVVVPQDLVYELGFPRAFEQVTGHPSIQIVGFYPNLEQLCNADGSPWTPNVDLVAETKDAQVAPDLEIQPAPALQIEVTSDLNIQVSEELQLQVSAIEAVPQIAG